MELYFTVNPLPKSIDVVVAGGAALIQKSRQPVSSSCGKGIESVRRFLVGHGDKLAHIRRQLEKKT